MQTLVKIEIKHSNHIDLERLHEKLTEVLEGYAQDYMKDADKYKDKSIDIDYNYYTKIKP